MRGRECCRGWAKGFRKRSTSTFRMLCRHSYLRRVPAPRSFSSSTTIYARSGMNFFGGGETGEMCHIRNFLQQP